MGTFESSSCAAQAHRCSFHAFLRGCAWWYWKHAFHRSEQVVVLNKEVTELKVAKRASLTSRRAAEMGPSGGSPPFDASSFMHPSHSGIGNTSGAGGGSGKRPCTCRRSAGTHACSIPPCLGPNCLCARVCVVWCGVQFQVRDRRRYFLVATPLPPRRSALLACPSCPVLAAR